MQEKAGLSATHLSLLTCVLLDAAAAEEEDDDDDDDDDYDDDDDDLMLDYMMVRWMRAEKEW